MTFLFAYFTVLVQNLMNFTQAYFSRQSFFAGDVCVDSLFKLLPMSSLYEQFVQMNV